LTATRSSDVAELTDAIGAGTAVTTTAPPQRRGGMPNWLGALIGAAVLVGLWWLVAVIRIHNASFLGMHLNWRGPKSGIPRPDRVLVQFWKDWGPLTSHNYVKTLKEAALGYIVANLLAIALGIAFVQVPMVEKSLLRIAVASYCLPIIAIAPILSVTLHGLEPQAFLAGLLVFFPTLIGVLVGLRSADKSALDVVRASGGGSWAQMTKVRLRAALPSTFAALQIAAPSAILGAIIGEYLGAQTSGLGVMMIVAQEAANSERLWAIALFCTAVAGASYALIGVLARLATPWAPRRGTSP
jgi:ABC-type nitrate/sulfonate/bicarbonate transport system permease component